MPDGTIIKLTKIKSPKKGKEFVALSPPLGGWFGLENIKIYPKYFDMFNYKQKVAILYHELWHRRGNELFELKLLLTSKPWRFFQHKWISHQQEFQADKQGARLGGKRIMLSVLKKLKIMISQGLLEPSHEDTHPKIDERISAVKEI